MSDIIQIFGTSLAYILFYLTMLAGVIIIPFGVPGEFLIVIAALVWWLVTGGHAISDGEYLYDLEMELLAVPGGVVE